MTITFLGTGADDWDWVSSPSGPRRSTCTLFGTTCLVDAGPCVLHGLAAAHVSPAPIRDLLVTHSHRDHFHPDAILEIARAARRRLRVWASPQALALLESAANGAVEFLPHPVLPGDEFRVAGMRALALPANHIVTARPDEQPMHYVFNGRGTRLLYALDGGWFCARARLLLKRFLGGRPLSAVVWDATCGNTFRDWRFAEHNDLRMIDAMRESMLRDGLVAPDTVHVFDHIARTLWPEAPAAQQRLAEHFGGVLAQDGLSLDHSAAPTPRRCAR